MARVVTSDYSRTYWTGSQNALYTNESKTQVKEFLGSARAYLNTSGGFINSPFDEIVERVITGMMAVH